MRKTENPIARFFRLLGESVDPFHAADFHRYLPKGESLDPWARTGKLLSTSFAHLAAEHPELRHVQRHKKP